MVYAISRDYDIRNFELTVDSSGRPTIRGSFESPR